MKNTRWKIRDYEFDVHQQTLIKERESVRIEPMMAELLVYFCHHQNQIISKEQLLDDVWHGRYVNDNTVSKLITKLRKALQDDPKKPLYIATIPKRGYRLVAPAELLSDLKETLTPSANHSVKRTSHTLATLLLSFVSIALFLGFYLSEPTQSNTFVSAKAVTSENGREYFPSFASDGIRLAYMNNDGKKFRLFVKNIYSGEQVEINHGAENGVGPGSWNDAGTKLVYLVASPKNCQYFIREFNGLTMSDAKLIHTCRTNSYGVIKFTHDDNVLIFTESPGMHEPYSLYSLELDTRKTQWLPQPELHLGGNSQFDMHPTENKILISSPNNQQWEEFYQLDLDSQKLEFLFKLNAYICCGIWSHDGEHVVMMGEHPARQIVQYALDGSDKTVLYTNSQQIHRPERHSNGIDYTFSVIKHDYNVGVYNLSQHQTLSVLNDSFDERLPVLSPSTKKIAYISLTSGNEELWLFERDTKKKHRVTQFEDGRHYVDLAWSPDEKNVAGLTLNSIHVINTITGKTKVLPLPEKEFRGISFKSPNILAFSTKLGGNWQVVEFNLQDDSMERLDHKWQSIQYASSADDWLWNDKNGNWYFGEQATPLLMPKHKVNAFYGRQFNVMKSGNRIMFYDPEFAELAVYEIGSDQPITSIKNKIGHFSMNGDVILFNLNADKIKNSDIYLTYSQNNN